MTDNPIDEYLDTLDEPAQTTLRALRAAILVVVPDAEECLAYGVPGFRVGGATVAGFSASKGHLSYLPHSGDVLAALGDDVAGYATSKGALKFAHDQALPPRLVRSLVEARLHEIGR